MLDLAVTQNFGIAFEQVVTHEIASALFQHHPVAGFDGGSVTGTVLLLLHLDVELVDIGFHAVLTQDQLGQIQRESICVI